MTTDIDTIRKWSEGVALHDQGKHQEAIGKFEQVREPNHKILFNVGCDFLCAGQLKRAVEAFGLCVQKDTNLSIGYFQCGICYHKLKRYRDAALNWNFALERVQGRKVINYSPLGLTYHLYECEIRHNLALTLLCLGDYSEASRVLEDAIRLQVTPKHKAVFTSADIACKNGSAFPLIEIPVNAIFRPDRALVANMSKKDYLGKAKVVAALDDNKTTGFSGIQLMAENNGKLPNQHAYPKTRGKKKGLLSRSLENILGVDDSDLKKETSKSSENVLDMNDKKGSGVCVGIDRERLEFLKKNVPQNAPPRPRPQRPAPKLKPTGTQASDVPAILPPQKIVRQQALKIPQGKKSGVRDISGQTMSSSNPELVGGYAGLDRGNIEETTYTDLKPEENSYEEVACHLKGKSGCSGGATFWPSGPSAMSVSSCHHNMDFEGTDNYYSTPSEGYYEDVDEMGLPDDARPFRPIKAKRSSRTTDDLPSRRIQERNKALQIGLRAQVAQTRTNKTTDDLPNKAPLRPKGPSKPGRPQQPKLSSNPCTIPQAGSGHLERPVSPVSPGHRIPPSRPPPRLSPEAVQQIPPKNPSFPKQFSSNRGAQRLKRPDQVSLGSSRQQQRHVSEGSCAAERKTSDCGVKVQKPIRPSLPEGGFAELDAMSSTTDRKTSYQTKSRQMPCDSTTCEQAKKSIGADDVAERSDERTCTGFTEEDAEILTWRF